MDFKRIQVLLILFFVVFDLYLAFLLSERGSFSQTANNAATPVNAVQEMKNRGVTIAPYINLNQDQEDLWVLKNTPSGELRANRQQLINQQVSIDPEGILTSHFDQPVELDISLGREGKSSQLTQEDFKWMQENILSDPSLFIHGDLYTNAWYLPQDKIIICRMVTPELPEADGQSPKLTIADSTAEIRILLDDDYNMISYIQTYQAPMVALEKTGPLISSYQAIETIENRIDTSLPNDAKIFSLSLSYYQSVATSNFNIYSPAWEVIYYRQENGQAQSILVDALKGKVVESKNIMQ